MAKASGAMQLEVAVAKQTRLRGVQAVKALPEGVQIHLADGTSYQLDVPADDIQILARGLSRHLRGARRTVATFLRFPAGEEAAVVIEEHGGRYTLSINEVRPGANPA